MGFDWDDWDFDWDDWDLDIDILLLLQQFRNAEQTCSAQQNKTTGFQMPVVNIGKIFIGLFAAQFFFGLLQMLFGMDAHMYYLP